MQLADLEDSRDHHDGTYEDGCLEVDIHLEDGSVALTHADSLSIPCRFGGEVSC